MFFALSIPKLYYCLKNFLCKFRYRQTVPQNLVLKIKTPSMSSNFGADQSACFVQIYKSSRNLLPLYFLCSLAEIYLNFSCSYTFVLLLRPAKVSMRALLWAEAGILKQCERPTSSPGLFPQKLREKPWGRGCAKGVFECPPFNDKQLWIVCGIYVYQLYDVFKSQIFKNTVVSWLDSHVLLVYEGL